MSWDLVKRVLLMKDPPWTSPAQHSVVVVLAQFHNDKFGYAFPSKRTIGRRVGLKPRRVLEVIVQLEALGVVKRLPPEYPGGVGRYLLMLDPPLPEQLNACPDAAERVPPHAPERVPPTWPSAPNSTDGTDKGTSDTGTTPGTRTAAAAAQPRLDALLSEVRSKKRRHLTTDPAADGNWAAVVKAADDVLDRPELGARLVKGFDGSQDGDVVEAIKRLCAKRHIDHGRHERVPFGIVRRALEYARTKRAIAAGAARPRERTMRPRDRRRARS